MSPTHAMDCSAPSTADADLQRRVVLCLARQAITKIEVEATAGVVILRGSLPSADLRWLAISTVHHIAGVMRVSDRMESDKPVRQSRGATRRPRAGSRSTKLD